VETTGASELRSNGKGAIASASLAQVTATPETYKCHQFRFGPSYKNPSPSPVVVVRLPGSQALTIGCRAPLGDTLGFVPWFSWGGQVHERVNQPADYSVSAS
jgi:hypothetical protein